MTNPTRQEIINVHNALKHLISYDLADAYTEAEVEEVHEREKLIRKFLPPLPQPTMAEVEWDDDLHYLAEAEHATLGKVVMIHPAPDTRIRCLSKWYGPYRVYNLTPAHLTPTGKRYTLTEVQE